MTSARCVDAALLRRCGTLFAETPLQLNDHLSARFGARIWLKREDLSPVRSYKIRGAFNFIRKALRPIRNRNLFVCASAGNHAQGFAYVCRHFGRKGVVFMPVTTPQQKIDKTRDLWRRVHRDPLDRRFFRRLLCMRRWNLRRPRAR
jgi:threonine dehydratase